MNLLLFGPPGAGKGTQSVLLRDKLGVNHISTGDLFRSAMKQGTELGLKAKGYIDSGNLVPDAVTIAMVREALKASKSGFVLDGFPRTLEQALALENMLNELGEKLDGVISLNVPYEVLSDRLTGRRVCKACGTVFHVTEKRPKAEGICDACGGALYQRSDDKESVIGQRLKAYAESTRPLQDFYKSKGVLLEVDGLGSATEIYDRIMKAISKFKK